MVKRRSLLRLLISLTILGALVACTGDSPESPITIDSGRYVALGDSYSAGEGLGDYLEGAGDPKDDGDDCHRSEKAYPKLLEFVGDVEVVFRACSGALIPHLSETPQPTAGGGNSLGLQVEEGVLGADVVLVTMTIGGNDAGFAKVAGHCATSKDCLGRAAGFSEGKSVGKWVAEQVNLLGSALPKLYQALRAGAPGARILVLGYPHIMPASQPRGGIKCLVMRHVYTQSERDGIRQLTTDVDSKIEAAANENGLEFVDTASFFEGHAPCGASGGWINLMTLDGAHVDFTVRIEKDGAKKTVGGAIGRGTLHPTATGHRMFARIVRCHLQLVPAPEPTSVISSGAGSFEACLGSPAGEPVDAEVLPAPSAS